MRVYECMYACLYMCMYVLYSKHISMNVLVLALCLDQWNFAVYVYYRILRESSAAHGRARIQGQSAEKRSADMYALKPGLSYRYHQR